MREFLFFAPESCAVLKIDVAALLSRDKRRIHNQPSLNRIRLYVSRNSSISNWQTYKLDLDSQYLHKALFLPLSIALSNPIAQVTLSGVGELNLCSERQQKRNLFSCNVIFCFLSHCCRWIEKKQATLFLSPLSFSLSTRDLADRYIWF